MSLALSGNDTISGATLRYAAFGLPAGLAINPSTGAITGTLAKGTAANGPYSVSVVAEDGTSSATQIFTWKVNSPITITQPAGQSNNEGDVVSLAVSATDRTQGATLSYAAVGLPAGLSINASSGVISGTVAAGNAGIGSFSPTVTASDGTSSSSISFNWSVGGVLSLPAPSDQANTVGDTVSLSVAGTDTGGTPVYTASGLPAGLSINQSTGLISGTISAGATAIGSYQTTVTANDGSRSATVNFTWTVSAAGTITMTTPANQTSAEGANVSVTVSATGGGTKTYFAQGLPPGLVINPSTGQISGTVALGAAAAGPYTVTVMATDGSNVAMETFTWTVTGAATLAAVANQTTTEGTAVNLSLIGNDTGGTLKYAAYGLPPGLAHNPSTGLITGTVALGAAANGPYIVTVVAADGTTFATQTFTWTINSPITLTAPANQTNTEGDPVNLLLTAHDASGTPTFSATGLPPGLAINPSNGTITGTIAAGASASGPYTVVLTASDGTYSTSQTFSWTVNNPITITNPGQLVATEGVSFSYQVQANSSVSGTPTYYANGLPPGLSINATTGLISGTPSSNSSQAAGPFILQIMVRIGNYVAVQTLPLFVLAPPPLGLMNVLAAPQQAPVPKPEVVEGNQYGNWKITQKNVFDIAAPYHSQVTIEFTPNKGKVNSTEIAFVQVAHIINTRTGKPVSTTLIGDEGAARRTADGWYVDRLAKKKYGWYGYSNDGKPDVKEKAPTGEDFVPVRPGISPMSYQIAILKDFPGDYSLNPTSNVRWEFQTYAIARSGKDKGKIYGGIAWGFSVGDLTKLTSLQRSFLATPSKQFKAAIDLWDKQAAGPVKKRNDPKQVPLGPSITFPK